MHRQDAHSVRKQYYRGKPPVTNYDADGLPVIVVCPTPWDLRCNFSDMQSESQDAYIDVMLRRTDCGDIAKIGGDHSAPNYDSQEISVKCFEDGRWPERTDLRCWWCLHQFDGRPFPCPSSMGSDGTLTIRGVFCGPSCAKAWAFSSNIFSNLGNIEYLINMLAQKRGYCQEGKRTVYIAAAPPRESLDIFCGPEGMNIAQFRGMCACGLDVNVLYPPIITEKQIIIAECERMQRAATHGRITHVDTLDNMMMSAVDCARRKREGFEIFAGVGTRRLSDYRKNSDDATAKKNGKEEPGSNNYVIEKTSKKEEEEEEEEEKKKNGRVRVRVTRCGPNTSSHRGATKRPLPEIKTASLGTRKKRQKL